MADGRRRIRDRAGPDCGHNIMLENPEGFVRATAAALAEPGVRA